MAFIAKTDPFDLEVEDAIVCTETNDNASASMAEPTDEYGDAIAAAAFQYAPKMAPSASYKLAASCTISLELGAVTEYKNKRIALKSVTVNTSAGSEPTISASGEQVEDDDAGTCAGTFILDALAVGVCHKAQILDSAFTLAGSGCHVKSCSLTAECEIPATTKDGVTIAHAVVNGRVTVQVEILQVGATEPTVTNSIPQTGTAPTIVAGNGYKVASPLSCSNPDADYPVWTMTLVKHLARVMPAANSTPAAGS